MPYAFLPLCLVAERRFVRIEQAPFLRCLYAVHNQPPPCLAKTPSPC